MATVLQRDLLLEVSRVVLAELKKQSIGAAVHPQYHRVMLVAVKLPRWLCRILDELRGAENQIFYGVPVVENTNDEIEAVWWDPTMPLDQGVFI